MACTSRRRISISAMGEAGARRRLPRRNFPFCPEEVHSTKSLPTVFLIFEEEDRWGRVTCDGTHELMGRGMRNPCVCAAAKGKTASHDAKGFIKPGAGGGKERRAEEGGGMVFVYFKNQN